MSDGMNGGIDRRMLVTGAVAGAISGVIVAVFYQRWIKSNDAKGQPDDVKRMLTFVATVAGVMRQFIEVIS